MNVRPLTVEERVAKLTTREREVMMMVVQGMTSAEIAEALGRSRRTVESHRQAIGRKLVVRNSMELMRVVMQAGLVTIDGQVIPQPEGNVPAETQTSDDEEQDGVLV